MESNPRVLVLLVNEALEDPRVFKTCVALKNSGARVTIGCTNPSKKINDETYQEMRIVRFPHYSDFILKRLYTKFVGRLGPGMGRAATSLHEGDTSSSLKAAVRNLLLTMNFRHMLRSMAKINRAMVRAFTGHSFDLVHCNDVESLAAGCSLKASGTARALLYDTHEFWPGMGTAGSFSNRAYLELEGDMIHRADYVVTVNPFIADLLVNTYKLEQKPAVVMNCPYVSEKHADITRLHSPVRVLYQGRVQAYRGLEELISSFRVIENAELTISGDGPLLERLKALATSEGLARKVHFTGRFDPEEAMTIIKDHDIGVIPYKPANLNNTYISPNKLFDYIMGGLALATSDLPFLASIIRKEKVGIVFDKLEPSAIARAITRMISNEKALQTYRMHGRRAALERYHWKKQFSDHYPWRP